MATSGIQISSHHAQLVVTAITPFEQYEKDSNHNYIYIGYSDLTSDTSKPFWIIKKFFYDSSNDVINTLTVNNAVWDDRATYF